jgi:hypothetical protein
MFKKNKVINPITNKNPKRHTSRWSPRHLIRGGSWSTFNATSSHRDVVFFNGRNMFIGYKICLKRIK